MSPQSEVSLTEKNRFFGFCLQKGWGGLTQFKNGFIIKKCEVLLLLIFSPKGEGVSSNPKSWYHKKLSFSDFFVKREWGLVNSKISFAETSGASNLRFMNWLIEKLDELEELN